MFPNNKQHGHMMPFEDYTYSSTSRLTTIIGNRTRSFEARTYTRNNKRLCNYSTSSSRFGRAAYTNSKFVISQYKIDYLYN